MGQWQMPSEAPDRWPTLDDRAPRQYSQILKFMLFPNTSTVLSQFDFETVLF